MLFMLLIGGKGQGGMDGGIRVPTVARWPSVIPPGSVVDIPTSTMDILPTITSMMRGEIPSDRVVDGKDILPLLRGERGVGVPHQFMVHYCAEQIHAARYTPADGKHEIAIKLKHMFQPLFSFNNLWLSFLDFAWFFPVNKIWSSEKRKTNNHWKASVKQCNLSPYIMSLIMIMA